MKRRHVILSIVTTCALICGATPAFSQKPPRVISAKSVPRATPRTLNEMRGGPANAQGSSEEGANGMELSGVSSPDAARMAQRLAGMQARSQQLQDSLAGLQSRLADEDSEGGEPISPEALVEQRQAVAALQAESAELQRALARQGQNMWAGGLAAMTPVLGSLDEQLALLGLVLKREGDKARVANALEFDLELLRERNDALDRLSRAQNSQISQDGIIRPAAGIAPDQDIIRPAEGINPSGQFVRPAQGISPQGDIIRPAEGINPSGQIVRPAKGISPQGDIIRPPAGITPPNDIIRPPSSSDLR